MISFKRRRKKNGPPQIVVDFQPDVAAVENQQPSFFVRSGGYILLALLVSAVLWASLAQIDRIITTTGKIVTTSQNYVVQPLEKALIRSINVGVGDIVKAGTPLVTLDPTFAAAELSQTQQKLNATRLQILMLNCELANQPFDPPAEFSPEMRVVAMQMFQDRNSEYKSRVSAQEETINSLNVNIQSMKEQIKDYKRQLEIVKEVEKMRKDLFERGADSKLSLLLAENSLISVNTQQTKAIFSLKDLQHSLEKSITEKNIFITNWRKETYKALFEAIILRNDLLQQISKQQRMSELIQLVAPADAVVLEMGKYSIGSVVREGDAVLTLVPLNYPLEAEVSIDTTEVGYVRVDDHCRIKLDTFPFQKHGTLDGKIRTISEDSLQSANPQNAQASGVNRTGISYKARITLSPAELRNVPQDFRLIPGMTLTAEIMVGKRRVISYFIYPIIRTLDESLREP